MTAFIEKNTVVRIEIVFKAISAFACFENTLAATQKKISAAHNVVCKGFSIDSMASYFLLIYIMSFLFFVFMKYLLQNGRNCISVIIF